MKPQVNSQSERQRRMNARAVKNPTRQTSNKNGYYPCEHCEWTFDKPSQRAVHLREIHGIGSLMPHIYKCDFCDYHGPSKARVGQHMRVHSDVKPFACPYPGCNYRTKYPQCLTDHLPRHDPKLSSRFKCKLCPKGFAHLYQLNRHLRSHTRETYKKCPECDFKAVNWTGLVSHRKLHHSEGYQKKLPAGKYPVAESAQVPVKYEEINNKNGGTTQYKCLFPDCQFVTKHKTYITHHINYHQAPSVAKWYKCDFPGCGFQTRASESLRAHKKIHNPDRKKDLQCSVCPKKFMDQGGLRRHMRTHGDEFYCCLFCDYEAVESCNVYRHMKKYHGDLWERGTRLEKRVRGDDADDACVNVGGRIKQKQKGARRVVISGRKTVRERVIDYDPVVVLERINIITI